MTTAQEYREVHLWLKAMYGKADRCESEKCMSVERYGDTGMSFHWALRADKEYEKKRENFFMLCPLCHRHYDIEHNLIGKYEKPYRLTVSFSNEQGKKIRAEAKRMNITTKKYVQLCVDHPIYKVS